MRQTAGVLLATLVLAACGTQGNGSTHEERPRPPAPPPTPNEVVFLGSPGPLRVEVEVARTHPQRKQGLMHRKELGPMSGMIFVFDRDEDHAFWMKNTLISLDMIFIDRDEKIVGIVHEAVPLSLAQRSVGIPSRYVLEVQGGWAKKHGIKTGQAISFRGPQSARHL